MKIRAEPIGFLGRDAKAVGSATQYVGSHS